MKVAVLGCGNVGVAIAADLSIKGEEVTIVKTSQSRNEVFDKIVKNGNRILLKENNEYKEAKINSLTYDLSSIASTDVIFVTVQSTYHEEVIKKMSKYLKPNQVVIVICSYMSSYYFRKFCDSLPMIAETTGPYLEGRIEEEDVIGEIVFRVGCRLTRSPLSVHPEDRGDECMAIIHKLYKGFARDYSVLESALLNPNMVLHTVGSIMSIPRIEFSKGVFCMYREAYARGNDATLNIMLGLDEEKKKVLRYLGCKPIDVFQAGGFLGDPMESFYTYSESSDRALSPTSVRSRYITEDVSQGLVLLESIAQFINMEVPVTSALINIANIALGCDFRREGRTFEKLLS